MLFSKQHRHNSQLWTEEANWFPMDKRLELSRRGHLGSLQFHLLNQRQHSTRGQSVNGTTDPDSASLAFAL